MASQEILRSSRELKNLRVTDGHGGKGIVDSNMHHVPWSFHNLPKDSCSECSQEMNNDGASNDGASNDGANNDGANNDGASNDGASNDGASNDGASNDTASNDGASNDGASNDGASNDGASNDGASNDGASNDEVSIDEMSTENVYLLSTNIPEEQQQHNEASTQQMAIGGQSDLNLLIVNELTLRPTTENDVIDVDDYEAEVMGEVTGVVLEDDDDEEDDEEFITLHTFADTDNSSMKIISFPEMKKKSNQICAANCV